MKIIRLIIPLIALFLVYTSASAANFTYVSAKTGTDSSNPACAVTAPCATIQHAYNETNPGGTVTILDSGPYKGFTITHAISIVAEGVHPEIYGPASAVFVISAGSSDVISLRGLTLKSPGTTDAIDVNSVGTLHIKDVTIEGFSGGIGISFASAGELLADDTLIKESGYGIRIIPTSGNSANARIDHCRFEDGANDGLDVEAGGTAVVRDSFVSGYSFGLRSMGATADLTVQNSVVTENTTIGISNAGNATTRIANVTVARNRIGLENDAGSFLSFENNYVNGNSNDVGSPPGSIRTVAPQ